MEIETLFGLPAHPFLIHAPLVLIPLTAIVIIGVMLRSATVRRWALPLAGVCVALLVLLQLAIGSGEAFKEMGDEGNTPTIQLHQAEAETLRLIVLGLTGVLVVLGLVARQASAPSGDGAVVSAVGPESMTDRRRFLQGGLRIVAGAAAVASIVYTVETGHTGATSVWHRRGERRPGEGESANSLGDDGARPASAEGAPATPAAEGGESGEGAEPGG